MANGRYRQRIEELILSLGWDYRLRGSSSRLYLRLVNNRIQLAMYCPSEIIYTRKNLAKGVLYVPCLEIIVAVIGLNQEGVGLNKKQDR